MKKNFLLIFLGLILTLAWPAPARSEDKAPAELGIFEFDYDQRNNGPAVNLPDASAAAPASAISHPASSHPASSRPASGQPAHGQPASGRPAPSLSKTPAAPHRAAPAAAKADRAEIKNGVITVIGEPAPPGYKYDDYLPDHKAPEITLSPAGLPPTTSIPAKPGEARVEKTAPKRPAGSQRAVLKTETIKAPSLEAQPPGSLYRFWQAAQGNWARYGGRSFQAAGVGGYARTGVPLQDISQFGAAFR